MIEVHGFKGDGSILATIDGQQWTVPDDPENGFRQMIARWEFDEEGNRVNTIPAFEAPPPPAATLSLQQVGAARLMVDYDNWEITGIEQSQGIAAAFLMDVDVALVFFSAEFPGTEYIVMPPDGITKHPGYVEVSRPGLSSISFVLMRVQ